MDIAISMYLLKVTLVQQHQNNQFQFSNSAESYPVYPQKVEKKTVDGSLSRRNFIVKDIVLSMEPPRLLKPGRGAQPVWLLLRARDKTEVVGARRVWEMLKVIQ